MKKLGNLIAGLLLTQALAPAHAQFNGPPAPAPTYCVQGPGDVQPYVAWGSVWRAYSMATCGMPAINVCDSTGGVDVACADMVTSATTGELVPKVIGGLTCGTDNSGNCTIKVIYDIPGAGAHNAVQNTIALRYGLYNGAVSGCNSIGAGNCGFSNASGAEYTLTSSLSLTQPFALMVVAYSNNASGTNTLLSVGNAAIEVSNTGNTNVLSTCDLSNSTATNAYQYGFAPTYLSDHILTCVGGSGTLFQNDFPGANVQAGGSTSVSGVPSLVVNSSSSAATDFWEFGITTANLIADGNPSFWTPYAMHANACLAYGYTCYFSGMGDVASFRAAWGLRAYSASVTAQAQGQKLIKACSADNTQCSDILSQNRSGMALNNSVGGTGGGTTNQACWTPITSGTYNNTTGAGVLTVDPANPAFDGLPTGLVSGDNFALSVLTGTGDYASLNGAQQAIAGTNSSTINFTGPALGAATAITGGYVSTCTIETFYDTCTTSGVPCNFCTGGVPCDYSQTTVGNRAIWTFNCIYNGEPTFYGSSCATFPSGSYYAGPGTASLSAPYTVSWAAQRLAGVTQQVVIGGASTGVSGFYTANLAFANDGVVSATGTAMDGLFHSVDTVDTTSSLRLFIDGSLSATTTSTGGSIQQPYSLGSYGGSLFFFQGQFFEAGLSNSDISSVSGNLSQQRQLFFNYVP